MDPCSVAIAAAQPSPTHPKKRPCIAPSDRAARPSNERALSRRSSRYRTRGQPSQGARPLPMSQAPGYFDILRDGFPTAHVADTPDHPGFAATASAPQHGFGAVFRHQMSWEPTIAHHPSTPQNEQSALVSQPGATVGCHDFFPILQDFPGISGPPGSWQAWTPGSTAFLSSFQVSPFYTQYHTMQIPTSNQLGRSGDTSPSNDDFQAYHPHPVGHQAAETDAPFPFTGPAVMAPRHEQRYSMPINCHMPGSGDVAHGWAMVDHTDIEFGQMSSSVGSDGSTSSSPLEGPFLPIPGVRDLPAEVYAEMTAAEPTPPSKTLDSGVQGPLEPRNPRKRGALAPAEREQTGKTRQISACLRCQMQRKRDHVAGGTCKTCLDVAMDSKKVIHKIECVRWKLTSAILHRKAGLSLTARWQGSTMYDMPDADWADATIRTIEVSEGLCSQPFRMDVRKFKPRKGDQTDRFWINKKGIRRQTPIPPYALVNIDRTSKEFDTYAKRNAKEAFMLFAQQENVHPLVRDTYKAAWDHMLHVEGESSGINLKSFMRDVVLLWFGMRHTTKSLAIVGQDKLDMKPELDPDYPFPRGHISVPRMAAQQFDSFIQEAILKRPRERVLKSLWTLMQKTTSKDRYRYARDNGIKTRYDMPGIMEELHFGANIILMVWTYFRRGFNPVTADWSAILATRNDSQKKCQYKEITEEQRELMERLCEAAGNDLATDYELPLDRAKSTNKGLSATAEYDRFRPKKEKPFVWERDLHFVSQMFKDEWQPEKTWERWDA